MSNWNASNYRQRKAARLALVKPSWVKNPETGEEFYLREVSSVMSSILSGYMPSGLTKVAVQEWKKSGLDVGEEAPEGVVQAVEDKITPEQLEAVDREWQSATSIVETACVIPFLSKLSPESIEFTKEWRESAMLGLKEKDPKFDAETFDPKDLVLHPKDLDDKDARFLMQWAQGIGARVNLKGGNVVSAGNFSATRRRLNRGSRVGTNKSAIQQAS